MPGQIVTKNAGKDIRHDAESAFHVAFAMGRQQDTKNVTHTNVPFGRNGANGENARSNATTVKQENAARKFVTECAVLAMTKIATESQKNMKNAITIRVRGWASGPLANAAPLAVLEHDLRAENVFRKAHSARMRLKESKNATHKSVRVSFPNNFTGSDLDLTS